MRLEQSGRCALLVVGCMAVGSAHAAKVGEVLDAGKSWMVAQVDAQKTVDRIDAERESLLDQYGNVLREADGLRTYNQQLRAQLQSQLQEMDAVRKESFDVERTSREILPLIQKMLGALEQFVALDTPFLAEERKTRINALNDMMPRADVTVSEKYRRIVEAYQVEMEYGRTIEGYEGRQGDKVVQFLRVGRVALMYQTPDGTETGYWDAGKKGWTVDNGYRDAVKKGLKVARKETSPDLLMVPAPAATAAVAAKGK